MSKGSSSSSSNGGIGFVCLLTVAFIVLKLTHYIDWPWVWVLAPIWIATLLVLVVIAAVLILAWVTSR